MYSLVFTHMLLLLLLLSRFSRVRLVRPHRRQPTRLPCPWDSPGKNTGVGCHFLLQCMKVKSEREVAQSCLTLSNPIDCSLRGSSVHGICQARGLEWVAIAFSNHMLELVKKYSQIWIYCYLLGFQTWESLYSIWMEVRFRFAWKAFISYEFKLIILNFSYSLFMKNLN